MSKLDELFKDYGVANPELLKTEIKILVLEAYIASMAGKTLTEKADIFHQKLREL